MRRWADLSLHFIAHSFQHTKKRIFYCYVIRYQFKNGAGIVTCGALSITPTPTFRDLPRPSAAFRGLPRRTLHASSVGIPRVPRFAARSADSAVHPPRRDPRNTPMVMR